MADTACAGRRLSLGIRVMHAKPTSCLVHYIAAPAELPRALAPSATLAPPSAIAELAAASVACRNQPRSPGAPRHHDEVPPSLLVDCRAPEPRRHLRTSSVAAVSTADHISVLLCPKWRLHRDPLRLLSVFPFLPEPSPSRSSATPAAGPAGAPLPLFWTGEEEEDSVVL
jgi:hypothetical protein